MYTSIDTVRTMSGLDDDTNISDSNIKDKILRASALVSSSIGSIYSLPLAYRFQNTLTFSGTATSSGTMNIVVNGITYSLTITSGETAEEVANNFRILTSNDFVTDKIGDGEQVLFISVSTTETTAYKQVNITSAPDTAGISTTIGTRIRRYPQVIDQITAEIATALLFIDIYGVEGQDTGKDGENRMDRVNELLDRLQGNNNPRLIIIDDVTNEEIGQTTTGQAESYPNDTSDTDSTDPTSPKAFMNKTF